MNYMKPAEGDAVLITTKLYHYKCAQQTLFKTNMAILLPAPLAAQHAGWEHGHWGPSKSYQAKGMKNTHNVLVYNYEFCLYAHSQLALNIF